MATNDRTAKSQHHHLVWLDQICDRFENAWGTARPFSIESILQELPAEKHEPVLKALLQLEWELRAKTDRPMTADELSRRFPEQESIVDSVLRNQSPLDSLAEPATVVPKKLRGDAQSSTNADRSTPGPLRIPRQLGRYRIVRKLGQGAMGSVFQAHDDQLDRPVAIKIPRGDVQRNRELRTRFQREAQAAAGLHHPNICPIYDIGELDGIHYICMGYIDGCSLTRYAVAESGLSEQRIAQLVLKLARALAVAHEAGFIHRDLKPANVMINENDDPVILNFGLARRIDRNEDTRVTQTGTTVGSPAYMSPEQVDGHQDKIGPLSDVYSLGVILYELLTGRIPFEGSIASVMGQIMMKEPDSPSDYRKDLSVRLENICLRMMAKAASERPPSMHAVAAALQEYLERYANSVPVTAGDSPVGPQSVDKGQQRKQQIEQLIKSGDYGQAEKLMVMLSRETDDAQRDAATWASAELPILRKTREEVRAGRQEMYSTASRLVQAHDYEQAQRLLEEYPYDLRTPKMQDLLERAERMAHEVQRLRSEIAAARNRGDNAELLSLTIQLLEIRPGDRRAKELHQQLTKMYRGPLTQLLGGNSPPGVDRLSSGAQWILLSVVLLVACAYPAYLWSSGFLASAPQQNSDTGPPDDGAPPPFSSGYGVAADGTENQQISNVQPDVLSNVGGSPTEAQNPGAAPAASSAIAVPFPTFTDARELSELNEAKRISAYPWISLDGMTICWTQEDSGGGAIQQATRSGRDAAFRNVRTILNGGRIASLSADGLEIVTLFDANRDGQITELCFSRRSSLDDTFPPPQLISALSSVRLPKGTAFSDDGLSLLILAGAVRKTNTPAQIMQSKRKGPTDTWGTPIPVAITGQITPSNQLGHPSFANSGQRLVFSYTEEGSRHFEWGAVADRATDSNTFQNPRPLLLDGKRFGVRGGRYCDATGEFFFTRPVGAPPYREMQLWVADANFE